MPDDHRDETRLPDPALPRQPHDASTTPKDLKVKLDEQRLQVEWLDGTKSDYAFNELRRECPCATCKTEREKKDDNPLRIFKSDPENLRVTHAELVGTYAIRFTWSDGHSTGIFDFRYLRSLQRS